MNKGQRIGFRGDKNPADVTNSEVGKLTYSMLTHPDEIDLNQGGQPVDTSKMTLLQQQRFGVVNSTPMLFVPGTDVLTLAPGAIVCIGGPAYLLVTYDASGANLLVWKTADFVNWETSSIAWASTQFAGSILWTGSEYLMFCYDFVNTRTFGCYSADGLSGWTQFTISITEALLSYGNGIQSAATQTKIFTTLKNDSGVVGIPLVINKPLSASPTMTRNPIVGPVGFKITGTGPTSKGVIVDNAYYTEDMSTFTKVLENGWVVEALPYNKSGQLFTAYRTSMSYTLQMLVSADGLNWTKVRLNSMNSTVGFFGTNKLFKTTDSTGRAIYVIGPYMSYDLKTWTSYDNARVLLGIGYNETFMLNDNLYSISNSSHSVVIKHDFSLIKKDIMPTEYSGAKLRIK